MIVYREPSLNETKETKMRRVLPKRPRLTIKLSPVMEGEKTTENTAKGLQMVINTSHLQAALFWGVYS